LQQSEEKDAPDSFMMALTEIESELDMIAEEIVKQGEVNTFKRQKKQKNQASKLHVSTSTTKGVGNNSSHAEMHAEAHISEILESEKQSSDSENEGFDEGNTQSNIWTNVNFWDKQVPIIKKKETQPAETKALARP
jgi:hypothetical protein